jgi:hypothetical protein
VNYVHRMDHEGSCVRANRSTNVSRIPDLLMTSWRDVVLIGNPCQHAKLRSGFGKLTEDIGSQSTTRHSKQVDKENA